VPNPQEVIGARIVALLRERMPYEQKLRALDEEIKQLEQAALALPEDAIEPPPVPAHIEVRRRQVLFDSRDPAGSEALFGNA
jgi:hypothetical protein